jgi:hypothetical protein
VLLIFLCRFRTLGFQYHCFFTKFFLSTFDFKDYKTHAMQVQHLKLTPTPYVQSLLFSHSDNKTQFQVTGRSDFISFSFNAAILQRNLTTNQRRSRMRRGGEARNINRIKYFFQFQSRFKSNATGIPNLLLHPIQLRMGRLALVEN